jgi:thiamine kinase-like enzyme
MAEFSDELRVRVERLLNDRVTSAESVTGGYTAAGRRRLQMRSGATVFVKFGADAMTAEALRREWCVYSELKAPFMPQVWGWEDHPLEPVMVLEDLSGARWPPPWDRKMVDDVRSTLESVHASAAGLGPSVELHGKFKEEWREVAKDPEPFIRLGLVTPNWLERALPALLDASAQVEEDGDDVIHLDVRSDNLCRASRGIVLIDWSWACLGNGALDLGFWLPSLQAEGGPAPEEILPGRSDIAACVSGYFAARAGRPPIANAPHARAVQLLQLRPALRWAARALGLPEPIAAAGCER